MALNIPTLSQLSTPPSKSNPANFAERADTFLGELPVLQTEMNEAIIEMNKITAGLDNTEPTAAYNPATTYNFPDVVACTDGHTYRCIDTGVVGVNPIGDTTNKWVMVGYIPVSVNWDNLNAVGTIGATVSLACNFYDTHTFTCGNATTAITLTSFAIGRTITLIITNGGSSTITWPTGTKWPNGTAPTLTTSGTDRIVMQRVTSTVIHASIAGTAYA
jgi:hypothetical protein